MLKELAEYLFNSGANSLKATLQPLPHNPEKTLLLTPGEPHEVIETPRLPDALVLTVPTIEDFAAAWGSESASLPGPAHIFFSATRAHFWLDQTNHAAGCVALELPPHPLWEELESLEGDGAAFDQRALLRKFRGLWRPALRDYEAICSYFRTITWEGKRTSQQTIIQGAATGGGQFAASGKTAADNEREFFLLDLPFWADQQITCDIGLPIYCELDPDGNGGGKVRLWTIETDLLAAKTRAREAFRLALENKLGPDAPLLAADAVTLTRRA